MSGVLFRIFHLLIDTHQGVIAQFVGLVDYLNYSLNFTSLVSGPIQRFEDFADSQLRPDRLPCAPLNLRKPHWFQRC
jgi:D-alanyl-lipoteichoic acid acyltransferase DltB (MBOAT superfamily)